MQIYIRRNEEEFGPYSKESALEYLKQGGLELRDRARLDGTPDYLTLGEILGADDSTKNATAAKPVVVVAQAASRSAIQPRTSPMKSKVKATARKKPFPAARWASLAALVAAGAFIGFSRSGEPVRAYLAAMVEAMQGSHRNPVAIATPAPHVAIAPVVEEAPPVVPDAPAIPVAPAVPSEARVFDPAKLAANPAAWPKSVHLKQDAMFPAVVDGRSVGTVNVLAGTAVKLVQIAGENVTLDYQGGRKEFSWKGTDLEEEAARVVVATPAPVRAVAAKTVPENALPALNGSWMWKTAGPNYNLSTNIDTSSMPERYAFDRALIKWKYQLTPEVESAYLHFSKALALREITNSRSLLPTDFLAWIDSDPIVEATIYGARKDAAGILCMLRSLELDLGKDVVRHDYTQLALAVAVVEAKNGASADLNPRNLLQLTIPCDPRHPVDTKAKDRPLDVNDHIINFLEDHAPIEGDSFGKNQIPPELKYDSHGVAILSESKTAKGEGPTKVKRALLAADVIESKSLQDEFNAYMAAHGQSVRIDCGDHVISPNQHDMIKGPYADGILKAYKIFRTAYEAKGRLPQSRDAFATPAERIAFLIRNDAHFPEHKESQRKWERYSLKSPWPTLTLLAGANDPLREREEVWERFCDTGEAITYGEYIGGIAQQFDYQSARRLSPYAFTYGSFQMMMKDGGVCGTMANMSVRTHTALGTPACTAGQPGHCALILFSFDKKTRTYNCHGEQYATGGDDKTHPHANWVFGDTDERRDMAWHQSVAWGVNAGFQSYLDSMVALEIYRRLPKNVQKEQGLTLLQSGLGKNRYNISLVEAAVANGDAKDGLDQFGTFIRKLLAEHGTIPGCPSKSLYNTAIETLLEKHGATMDADGKDEVAAVGSQG